LVVWVVEKMQGKLEARVMRTMMMMMMMVVMRVALGVGLEGWVAWAGVRVCLLCWIPGDNAILVGSWRTRLLRQ